jgi:starch-binding outer membrane protein, SusD/RagB family
MRDELAHQRLLEFCLEGHRFDGIRRWGWLTDQTKLALLKSNDPEMTTYLSGRDIILFHKLNWITIRDIVKM